MAALDLARYEPARTTPVPGSSALTAKAATALDRAFGTTAFERGLALGTLRASGLAQPLRFTGGETRVTLNPRAVQAITAAGASLTPLAGTAARARRPTRSCSSRDSRLDYVSFVGNVLHRGGLRFTAPAGRSVGGAQSIDLDAFSVAYEKEGFTLRAGGAKARRCSASSSARTARWRRSPRLR